MKRVMLLAVGAAFALVIVSGAALAATFQCTEADCFGTNNNDLISERQGNGVQDDIHARGGDDDVRAGRFNNDTDVLRGNGGSDTLRSRETTDTRSGDDQDVIICGNGNDTAVVDAGDTVVEDCETVVGNAVVVSPAEAEALAAE